ncbi:MAG TPA: flavodoxin family protein [Bacteroidales bacterium]|nr:flavodoxin family protein [Bacteroidales bacterium]
MNKIIVLYDSGFGNTKQIAQAIVEGMGDSASLLHVSEFTREHLNNLSFIVAGSPINGFMPTEKMQAALKTIPAGALKGIKAASFDTRMHVWIHGDAAKKISKRLAAAGAEIIAVPAFFHVTGKEGPLAEGETERAIAWGRKLVESF